MVRWQAVRYYTQRRWLRTAADPPSGGSGQTPIGLQGVRTRVLFGLHGRTWVEDRQLALGWGKKHGSHLENTLEGGYRLYRLALPRHQVGYGGERAEGGQSSRLSLASVLACSGRRAKACREEQGVPDAKTENAKEYMVQCRT